MTLIVRVAVGSFEPRQATGLEGDWSGLMTFAKTFTAGDHRARHDGVHVRGD